MSSPFSYKPSGGTLSLKHPMPTRSSQFGVTVHNAITIKYCINGKAIVKNLKYITALLSG
jgi:hypothetical protein